MGVPKELTHHSFGAVLWRGERILRALFQVRRRIHAVKTGNRDPGVRSRKEACHEMSEAGDIATGTSPLVVPDPRCKMRNLPMPRYFFNLTRDGNLIADRQGVDLPDDAAACRVAIDVIEEFRMRNGTADIEGWRLEVVDTTGREVATIPIRG